MIAGRTALALAAAIAASAGCAIGAREDAPLARARVTADYASYRIARVGILPFRADRGEDTSGEQSRALQAAFVRELGRVARFEIVALDAADLEEIPESEPFRRGWTRPATVLELGRRYDLDAILAGTIAGSQSFAPQKLALEIDLVSTETGLPIWSSGIALDAGEERTRTALAAWHGGRREGEGGGEGWELALISPRRFAEFAAAEIARGLPAAR